jgi:hypothetical protein
MPTLTMEVASPEPERRQDGPHQAGEIFLRMMRRRGRLAEREQNPFRPEAKRHQRQRDQQRSPQADAQRAADQMRVARAEALRGERRDRGHQAHPDGEADEEHGMRQRRGRHGLGAETPDHGKVGRHHCDLAKLGQRDRRREFQRLGKFDREVAAGRGRGGRRRDRCRFDFVR